MSKELFIRSFGWFTSMLVLFAPASIASAACQECESIAFNGVKCAVADSQDQGKDGRDDQGNPCFLYGDSCTGSDEKEPFHQSP